MEAFYTIENLEGFQVNSSRWSDVSDDVLKNIPATLNKIGQQNFSTFNLSHEVIDSIDEAISILSLQYNTFLKVLLV